MQDKLADKWAVEITCPQDAERLQALFPQETEIGNDAEYTDRVKLNSLRFTSNTDTMVYSLSTGSFLWGTKKDFIQHGYTIYTITELENLLKPLPQQ